MDQNDDWEELVLTIFVFSDPDENLHLVLSNIVQKDSITKHKKLGFFNAFVRLSHRLGGNLGTEYTTEKVLSW